MKQTKFIINLECQCSNNEKIECLLSEREPEISAFACSKCGKNFVVLVVPSTNEPVKSS